ncbi:sensor domain-containing protein [Massilia sp. PWRC2]|uniref:sensor domain-containing protein n=1 Tax=Massilia sp. PWRC2 TaxID=2804626 RepID=UPI003CF1B9B9
MQMHYPGNDPEGAGLAALDFLYRFVAAVELTPNVAVHSCDRDGTLRYWNKSCETLFGVPARDAIGQHLTTVVPRPGHNDEFDQLIAHVWDSGEVPAPRDWLIERADGSERWVYSSHYAISRDGFTRQVLCMEIDVTGRKVDEAALRSEGVHFRQLFERSNDAIVLLRGNIVMDANPAALRLFGCEHAQLVGHSLLDFSPEQQPGGQSSLLRDADFAASAFIEGNEQFEWQYKRCNGELFFAEVLLTSVALDHEQLAYAVIRDISTRLAAEQTLLMAAQVFDKSRDAILILDREQRVLAVNQAFTDITGYAAIEVIGRPLPNVQNGPHEPAFYQQIWDYLTDHDHWEGEIFGERANHDIYPVHVALTAIRRADGAISSYIVILSDISNRRLAEEHTRHLAEHDFLTDLPNRVLFLDRLQQALATARRRRTRVALMFIDLDRFKQVNDSLGHQAGDAVLKELALRMTRCVRTVDTVSRHGGDEFVIILADIRGADQAAHVAATVMQAVAQPMTIRHPLPGNGSVPPREDPVAISASIGIAMFPDDGDDADTLLQHADVAMYHAKQAGRNTLQFFSPAMNAHLLEQVEVEQQLRQALALDQFELHYQKVIQIASGRTLGVEALLRWRHPQQGLLQPQQFLPVAESAGLMGAIGEWVLGQACRQGQRWHAQGYKVIVGVNLSPSQFLHGQLMAVVDAALLQSGLDAAYLELDIAEAMLVEPDAATVATIDALHRRGVRLTVDGFGAGYSSLASLRRYRLSALKIDQRFIDELLPEPGVQSVVPAIIAVARSLQCAVIAESVEQASQLRYLEQHGCDAYQGWYAGMPSPEPDLGDPLGDPPADLLADPNGKPFTGPQQ